jgi:hypothetical protein
MSLPLNSAQLRFLWAMRISMAAKAIGLVALIALLAYVGVLR